MKLTENIFLTMLPYAKIENKVVMFTKDSLKKAIKAVLESDDFMDEDLWFEIGEEKGWLEPEQEDRLPNEI